MFNEACIIIQGQNIGAEKNGDNVGAFDHEYGRVGIYNLDRPTSDTAIRFWCACTAIG